MPVDSLGEPELVARAAGWREEERVREAVASGTVAVGTTDYTPDPSVTGFIEKDAFHEVTITH